MDLLDLFLDRKRLEKLNSETFNALPLVHATLCRQKKCGVEPKVVKDSPGLPANP